MTNDDFAVIFGEPPVESPTPTSTDPRGYTTLAVYMQATEDATKWFSAEGNKLMQDSVTDEMVTLKTFGMECDRAMVSNLGVRITQMVAAATAQIEQAKREWGAREWDGNPVGPVTVTIDSFELDESIPLEAQYPSHIYMARWVSVIATHLYNLTAARVAQQGGRIITDTGNGNTSPKDFWKRNPRKWR